MSRSPVGTGTADDGGLHELGPRVAVITVTYNRAHVLANALDSALSQDYPNLRVIVVDDGSTDDTTALLRRYGEDARVTVARHETNLGMPAARNTALACLDDDDDYFCYLDSDDKLVPGAITTMVEAFRRSGDQYSMIWAGSRNELTGEPDGWHSLQGDVVTYADFLAGRYGGDFMELVRRDLAAGLRVPPKARQGDGIIWAQILRQKPALLVDDVVQLTDRTGADRLSHRTLTRDYAEAMMWYFAFSLNAVGADLRIANPRSYAGLVGELGLFATMAGDKRRARLASRSALRLDPSMRSVAVACASLLPAWLVLRFARTVDKLRASRRAARDTNAIPAPRVARPE
jgi:hypothetical protein